MQMKRLSLLALAFFLTEVWAIMACDGPSSHAVIFVGVTISGLAGVCLSLGKSTVHGHDSTAPCSST